MKFNVICGLPRAGSTLLCNILNQNPKFHASSTSPIAQEIALKSNYWSNSPEVKSDLVRDREWTEAWMLRSVRSTCTDRYFDKKNKVVFDKGRGWAFHALLLKQAYPDAKIIVMVRDLRAVFASVEKQHQKNPILDHAMNPIEKTVHTRADQMFSPEGIIGGPVNGVLDLIQRRPPGLIVIQYEAFAQNPAMIMERLYAELGAEPFSHDFENVENTSTDLDALYLGKFPHDGSGAVKLQDDWQQFVSADLAQQIMGRYPGYNKAFSYI
ncbi:MAG: sulfotransferase family protein [Hyphomicrobiaceae bacterium]